MKEKYIFAHELVDDRYFFYNILTKGSTFLQIQHKMNYLNTRSPELCRHLEESLVLPHNLCPPESLLLYLFNKVRYNSEILVLTDALSFNCNLRCVYCMQQTQREVFNFLTLQPKERVNLWQQLHSIFRPKEFQIVLFGGEPFFNLEYVEELLSETKQKNLPVKRYGAITNGTICNDNLIRILREYPFRVLQITLDGPLEVHNQRRVDTEGQGTWELIVANIKNILEETEIRIVIHTVIDSQNWKYYGELLELLLTRLGSWIYSPDNRLIFNLGMESHPSSSCAHSRDYIPDPEAYAEIYLSAVQTALNKGVKIISCMSESICMYNKEYDLAIGPNGSIYKCISGIGLERFKVSSRDEVMEKPEFFIVRHAKFLGFGKGDHTCPSCRFFPVCGGGCEYNAYVQGCKKDCWQRFHEIALPKMVEILSSIDFVEPDIWVKRSGN